MRLFERRDRLDWWLTRSWYVRKLPLALMMLLALAAGLGVGVIIMAGHGPAVGQVVPVLSDAPPGGVQVQQATSAPDVVPLPMEEMTVIEPVQTAAPKLTEADLRAYEKAIWQEVNRRREMNGLPALMWDERIATAARFHSSDMSQRNYFEHADPEGVRAGQRLASVGIISQQWGENILLSRLPFDAQDDVQIWWNSPGHRTTLLEHFHITGVGVSMHANGQVYITQNFVS